MFGWWWCHLVNVSAGLGIFNPIVVILLTWLTSASAKQLGNPAHPASVAVSHGSVWCTWIQNLCVFQSFLHMLTAGLKLFLGVCEFKVYVQSRPVCVCYIRPWGVKFFKPCTLTASTSTCVCGRPARHHHCCKIKVQVTLVLTRGRVVYFTGRLSLL